MDRSRSAALFERAVALAPLSPAEFNAIGNLHRRHGRIDRAIDAYRDALRAERSAAAMAPAIEALSRTRLPFRAVSELGNVAERIAAVAKREGVDEIVMGTGRHPQWLRWLNPSIAQAVMERTDIPVTVLARGQAGALERYALPAGLAGLAALLIAAE